MGESPSQTADRVQSNPESNVVALGCRTVTDNSGQPSVSLPKETAEGEGIDPGDEMHVGYDPVEKQFVFQADKHFDGW